MKPELRELSRLADLVRGGPGLVEKLLATTRENRTRALEIVMLAAQDDDVGVRAAAAKVLGEWDDLPTHSINTLDVLLSDADARVREAALDGLSWRSSATPLELERSLVQLWIDLSDNRPDVLWALKKLPVSADIAIARARELVHGGSEHARAAVCLAGFLGADHELWADFLRHIGSFSTGVRMSVFQYTCSDAGSFSAPELRAVRDLLLSTRDADRVGALIFLACAGEDHDLVAELRRVLAHTMDLEALNIALVCIAQLRSDALGLLPVMTPRSDSFPPVIQNGIRAVQASLGQA